MITFRDVIRRETTHEKLDYLASRIATCDAEGLFVEAGELEQAVLDAVHPLHDGWGNVEERLRALSRASAATYLAGRTARQAMSGMRTAAAALDDLARCELPPEVEVRAPEGYIHYALDPVGYALAARRYLREVGPDHAERAVVLGVRSVGTGLSAMVAAELGAARSATLRPRGEPGNRAVSVSLGLRNRLLHWMAEGGDALIVDEGPGATGETFYRIASWLCELGFAQERIVLFPSGLQPPGLAPAEVRRFFERSRRFPPPSEDDRVERICGRFGLSEAEDLSAGRWRGMVPGAEGAVAVPRHERRKYRARGPHGRTFLIRYAGLGRSGAESALRAGRLASAGFAPAVLGREAGFLMVAWTEGEVVPQDSQADRYFIAALSAYLSARFGLFRTGVAVDVGPLLRMLRENATEAFGGEPSSLGPALDSLERLPAREATLTDARLQGREWLRTANGYAKLDHTDHGDGVRFPGPTDAAWDLAGATVEFGLDEAALSHLLLRCTGGSTRKAAELASAVAAYRAPYAACQLGEMALSAREVAGTDEEARLLRETTRYRRLLQRELGRFHPARASA